VGDRGFCLLPMWIEVPTVSASSVRASQRAVKPMPTENAASESDDLRPEYDLSTLTGGVRGKYYERATAGTTLVLLDRDVAEAFPDGKTINGPEWVVRLAHRGRFQSVRRPCSTGWITPDGTGARSRVPLARGGMVSRACLR